MAWDGLLCWNTTPAGQTAAQSCPWYVVGFDTEENATRMCMPDGTWFVNQTVNRTWTNFTMCAEQNGMATVVVSFADSTNSSLVQVSRDSNYRKPVHNPIQVSARAFLAERGGSGEAERKGRALQRAAVVAEQRIHFSN
ncbi:hypothetical protein ONE63_001919 [Megalurothrips usitatus]|uniref:G-protein coupled receptors family 2 profile 1 domain-containing protein n=1 Tax=Megalurothrips usitatus TaxID=439358 RepID=A0AAV7XDV5_9NEOP|nr:hypothetical protein ONE63_001919 [Megalurothrips usitatus]